MAAEVRAYAALGVDHVALSFAAVDPAGIVAEAERFQREVAAPVRRHPPAGPGTGRVGYRWGRRRPPDPQSTRGDGHGRQDPEASTQAEEAEEAHDLTAADARGAGRDRARAPPARSCVSPRSRPTRAGGNPAGVWIGEALPPTTEMQRIAAEVGYSETAFLAPDGSGLRAVSASATSARWRRCRSAATRRSRAASPWPSAASRRRRRRPPATRRARRSRRTAARSRSRPRRTTDGRTRATLTSVATWVREPGSGAARAALEPARLASRRARPDAAAGRRVRRRAGTSSWPPASRRGWRRLDYPFERAQGADARRTT